MRTLEESRQAILAHDRTDEILNAVDYLIKTHDNWENDPKAPDLISEALEDAMVAAFEVCEQGDVPAKCRELCMVAIPRMRMEWEDFADGTARRSDGMPTARFWSAFQAVVKAREGAKPFFARYPESVKELKAQGVSDSQIANHIYGHRGVGPFLRPGGSIDHVLISREAETPGSVLGPDWQQWMHPLEVERKRKHESEVDGKLAKLAEKESNEPVEHKDGGKIEDFLLQGISAEIIAKVKGMPLTDVLEVKRRMEASRADHAKAIEENSDDKLPPIVDVEGFIAEQLQANLGIPEIAALLKEHGIKRTQKEIREIAEKLLESVA